MPLTSTISLLVHLLLAGWMGLLISGHSLGGRHRGQDLESKTFYEPLISQARKSRNANIEEGDGIKAPARILFLRSAPKETTLIQSRDNYVLECEVGGNPLPVVTWLKDGVDIEQEAFFNSNSFPEDEATPSGLGATTSRLFIDCMSPKDIGEYTCVATTPYQRISSDTTVFLSPTDLSSELNPSCHRPSSTDFESKPEPARIHMWTNRLLQVVGKDVLLMCRSVGDPPSKSNWTKNDGETLPRNGRIQVLKNGDLLIRKVKWSDMGLYNCEVENLHGKDNISSFLYPMGNGK